MRRPVYVRGRGAVSSFSNRWAETFQALAAGRCAIRPVTRFDVTGFPCTVAATVDLHLEVSDMNEGGSPGGFAPSTSPLGLPHVVSGPSPATTSDRRLALAREAGQAAMAEASLCVKPSRLGVFIGAESGRTGFGTVLALARAAGGGGTFDARSFAREAIPLAPSIEASTVSPATVASVLASEIQAEGPVQTISMACASGAAAIAEGARAIRMGQVDAALCGGVGTDADPLMLAGFGQLGALSAAGISRPFDAHRDGFIVGEGAAFLVLSSEPGPLGIELAGFGRSLDAFHLTAPDPEGDGMRRAIETALLDAAEMSVDLIQAHGTSTPLNDALEALALRRSLGEALTRIPLGSVKGALGHWIAGAGALGALAAVEGLVQGLALPTAGFRHPDPDLNLDVVTGEARPGRFRTALANAFAFGGANCSLLFRRLV